MARMIFIGGGLALMAVSTAIMYCALVVASGEDDELEKMQKWEPDKEKEGQAGGDG